MEEEWNKGSLNEGNSNDSTGLSLIKELDEEDYENVQVYEGDLNSLTFSHVKGNDIFDTRKNKV